MLGHLCLVYAYLVSTPLQSGEEKDDSDNTEEATNVVDTLDDLLAFVARHVRSRRRVIEKDSDDETTESPYTTEQTNVAEVACMVDQLSPHD